MLALKNNTYQSRTYLRIIIFSNKDLTYKDHAICNTWTIKEDIYVSQISNFTVNKSMINAEANDIVYVVDSDNKLVYLGLIDNIEDSNIKVPVGKINTKSIMSLFDLTIFLKDFKFETGKIGDLIKDLIINNFVNTPDKEFNKNYFNITIDPNLSKIPANELDTKNGQELSLLEFFKTIYDTFEVYLDFNLDLTNEIRKLNIFITKWNEERYTLRDNLADISNIKISNLYNQTVNRLDFYTKDINDNYLLETQYFLTKDNFVKSKKEIKPEERIFPIITKAILSDNLQTDIESYANQELKGNIYSHLIEFDIFTSTKIINLDALKLRNKITIYINNEIYESVLSAYEYHENKNILNLSLGKSRLKLTDRLKLKNF